jgi:glyoxylase-like metal-dependent hydrolase (beta-lactamase superfamily II)
MEEAQGSAAIKAAAAGSSAQSERARPLQWDTYVTPGIPVVMAAPPPTGEQTYFQAMASTLIYGARDAVLVDAYMTVEQANTLAEWVASKDRNLAAIYITHGHGDHWFCLGTLLERFPGAKVVATAETLQVVRMNASPQALDGAWKPALPGRIPTSW